MADSYDDLKRRLYDLPEANPSATVEPIVNLSETSVTIDDLLEPLRNEPDLTQRIRNAEIVLIPTKLRSDTGLTRAFPDGTHELYQHLQGVFGRSAVEAAIHDNDYQEAAFHHDNIMLAHIMLVSIELLPSIITALTSYINIRSGTRRHVTVESEIDYKDRTGKQISVKYKGPSDGFEAALRHLYPTQNSSECNDEEDERHARND